MPGFDYETIPKLRFQGELGVGLLIDSDIGDWTGSIRRWHRLQTRTGCESPNCGNGMECDEQRPQKTPPQARQWCRRRRTVNG